MHLNGQCYKIHTLTFFFYYNCDDLTGAGVLLSCSRCSVGLSNLIHIIHRLQLIFVAYKGHWMRTHHFPSGSLKVICKVSSFFMVHPWMATTNICTLKASFLQEWNPIKINNYKLIKLKWNLLDETNGSYN